MAEPKITQAHSAFSLSCLVEVNIRPDAERIWIVLTDAKNFLRRNSTITRIEGESREGERLRPDVPGTDRIHHSPIPQSGEPAIGHDPAPMRGGLWDRVAPCPVLDRSHRVGSKRPMMGASLEHPRSARMPRMARPRGAESQLRRET